MAEQINYFNEIVKFDRLLRLFTCYKHVDDLDATDVRMQCEKILDKLKTHCPDVYEENIEKLKEKLNTALSKISKQTKPKMKSREGSHVSKKISSS